MMMSMPRLLVAVLAVVFAAMPRPAYAWGFEVHRYITSQAIPLLPAELRPFFEHYRTAIVEHAIDPDLWRTAGWEEEPPKHFVDMDAYGPYPFKAMPRDYDAAVARYGREFVAKNGTLPWRTEEVYRQLVEAFTQKAPYARENIKFFSSVVSHYVADAHVPFHAALNYNGQLTGQWGIHSRFESELFEQYRATLAVKPGPLTTIGNARDYVFATLVESFPFVQQVLDADRAAAEGREIYDAGYFSMFFGKVRPILERRLGDSIAGVASIIAAAWIEAGRPALPVEQTRRPANIRR
jgi:hypothetical protein